MTILRVVSAGMLIALTIASYALTCAARAAAVPLLIENDSPHVISSLLAAMLFAYVIPTKDHKKRWLTGAHYISIPLILMGLILDAAQVGIDARAPWHLSTKRMAVQIVQNITVYDATYHYAGDTWNTHTSANLTLGFSIVDILFLIGTLFMTVSWLWEVLVSIKARGEEAVQKGEDDEKEAERILDDETWIEPGDRPGNVSKYVQPSDERGRILEYGAY